MSGPGHRESIVPPASDELHRSARFSPALRVGRRLYVSGHTGEPDADIETQIRQAFDEVGVTLDRAGASWGDVVSITSYHVGFAAQVEATVRIHNEYVVEPYPAWTAVGVAELAGGSAVEVEVVAELPE